MNRIQIQTTKRSWAERHPIRSAILYTTLTIAFVIFLATGGIAVVTQLASILENTKEVDTPKNSSKVLPIPTLNNIPSVTNKKTLTVSGNSDAGATIRVYTNGLPNDFLANSNGKFTGEVNLKEGENTIKAQTVDGGNSSIETNEYKVVFDEKPPTLTIDTVKDGDRITGSKNKNLLITGKIDEAGQLTLNDRIIIISTNGSFSYNYNLSDGDNALNFKATDSAGNLTEITINVSFSS